AVTQETRDDRVESPGPLSLRRRLALGALPLLGGSGALLVMMAQPGRVHRAVLVGLVPLAMVVFGALTWLSGPRANSPAPRAPDGDGSWGRLPGEPLWMSPVVTIPSALVLACVLSALLGYGYAPYVVLAALTLL